MQRIEGFFGQVATFQHSLPLFFFCSFCILRRMFKPEDPVQRPHLDKV